MWGMTPHFTIRYQAISRFSYTALATIHASIRTANSGHQCSIMFMSPSVNLSRQVVGLTYWQVAERDSTRCPPHVLGLDLIPQKMLEERSIIGRRTHGRTTSTA